MNNLTKIFSISAILIAAVASASYAENAPQSAQSTPPTTETKQPAKVDPKEAEKAKAEYLKIRPEDYVMGNKNAKVNIFEYSSLSCPHCADFHAKTFPRIKQAYIDTGKANLVQRDFPLNEPALRAAQLTRCVGTKNGSEAFYRYIKVLFSTQEQWAYNPSFTKILSNISKLGGFNEEDFKACMENSEIEKSVLESRKIGSLLGVDATPSFFIGGKLIKGEKAFEELRGIIDPQLK